MRREAATKHDLLRLCKTISYRIVITLNRDFPMFFNVNAVVNCFAKPNMPARCAHAMRLAVKNG